MRRLFVIIAILFIICINGIAQEKKLSLEDAVLGQRGFLAPKNFPGLQWMNEKELLSVISDDWTSIKKIDLKLNKSLLLTLEEINNALKTEMKSVPYPDWKNGSSFYFNFKNNYYLFNLNEKSGRLISTLPEDSENIDIHKVSGRIAYTRGKNLFIFDNLKHIKISKIDEQTEVVCGQSIARSEFGITKGTFWSPSANLLAFYQKNESEVANYPLLDINVTPGQLNSIKYPMAGQKSESAQVGIFNPKKGRTVYLKTEGEKDQYLTNLAWDPSEKFVYVVVVNRNQNHIRFNKYSAEDGSFVKTLFEEKHPKYVEPEHPAWFLPNNSEQFIWMSERDGFMHLYLYRNDGTLLLQLSSGNWVVESILGMDASGENVIVSGTDSSGLDLHAYSINLKTAALKNLTLKPGYHNLSLHPDGSLLIDNYSNLSTPRVIRIIETKSGEEKSELLRSDNQLKDYKIGNVELHQLKSDNGTTLHARLIKPSNFDSIKKYPVLIYVYGGPHAQMITNSWLAASQLWMQYQAEKGYLVFTLDNRGSKSRGFEFENVIHRQLGTVEMQDQLKGVEWLKSQTFVDSSKMAIHGWSFGGFMKISMMLRNPGIFKAAVAGGPVTDWKYYEAMYGERYMDRPDENPEGYNNSRLANYVKNLQGDLMIIHGTSDDVVLEQHSLSLVKAFVENGILVDYFPYPMHKHNVLGKDRVHLMRKILTYIDDKLK